MSNIFRQRFVLLTLFVLLSFVSTDVIIAPIPSVSLDTPITDQDIAIIARDYLVSWEEISPHLELTVQQEHSIQKTYRIYEDQKREVLRTWKRSKGNGATYDSFITAAETISNKLLAGSVRALLKKEKLQHTSTGQLV